VDPRASADLLREAMVAGRLEHPNIVPVYLLGTTPEGSPLFVMRRIAGVPWSKAIADPKVAPEFFSKAREDALGFNLTIFARVCEAVHFAHSRGILHRDLKPDNVMLGAYGEVYVVDWGLAVSLGEDGMIPLARTATALAGTPRYLAPEMTACKPDTLSERTDVFLLGAVLFELLSGRAPFDAPSVMEQLVLSFECTVPALPEEVPPELAKLVMKALSRAPSDRHQSVDELRRAILEFVDHRASWNLSRAADLRAEALYALLGTGARDESDDRAAQANELFTECRYGYRQALEAWGQNEEATRGLQRVLERMIEHELARKNVRGAMALVPQLPSPNAELAARVELARVAEQRAAERLTKLEAFREDADTQLGIGVRGKILTAMSFFWLLASFGVGVLDRTGVWPFGYREAIAAISLNSLFTIGAGVWMRQTQKLNAALRRLLVMTSLMSVGLVSHWVMSYALRMSLTQALAQFLWWVAGGWICVGLLFDWKILLTGICFGTAGVAVVLWPGAQFFIFGLASFVGYGILAIAWAREDRKAA
jgi:serine/threonine-protein kinase